MTKTVNCPVCKNHAEWKYWVCPYGTEEEYITCPKCGYCYEFAYGNYLEIVKGKEFCWDYKTKESSPIFKRIKKAMFMAKRNWKKFKKIYH